jgi:hypothetical protein
VIDAKEALNRIEGNCKTLGSGWSEQIQYTVAVKYHVDGCKQRLMGGACSCPTKDEKRSKYVKRDGLLDQLKDFQANKDVDRNPKAARGAPRVKKVKYMPELNGFFTLDEITTDAYMLLDRVYNEGGRDRTIVASPLKVILSNLTYQMTQINNAGHDDLVREVLTATDRWVLAARHTLNLTVAEAQFADMLCGNCGVGGLSIAWDNSSEVRCIGTPAELPCGETYPMDSWIGLYEKGRQR